MTSNKWKNGLPYIGNKRAKTRKAKRIKKNLLETSQPLNDS